MAHVKLNAGAEFDILSAEEHKEHISGMIDSIEELIEGKNGTVVVRNSTPFTLDGSGNTPADGQGVMRIPTGYDGLLVRCVIDYPGSNATALKSCDVRILADSNSPGGLRSITNQLPNVFTDGDSQASVFRAGQDIKIAIVGGPATTQIYVTLQVILLKHQKPARDDTLEPA